MREIRSDRWSVLGDDDWKIDRDHNIFTAPQSLGGLPEQLLIFSDQLRNGSISADVTVLGGDPQGGPSNEAALVIRYLGPNTYFYAGLGGFGSKFFIGKAYQGPSWVMCSGAGNKQSVLKDKRYHLRIAFSGGRITLFENDVPQVVIDDETYRAAGQFGLRTWRTSAIFENLKVHKAIPRAFLVMPFKSEFDFVHKVIQESTRKFGIDCVRADQIAISRPVMEDVKTQIAEADLVIVDLTGKNPNVYYEAGLADALRKDWIVLSQSTDDLTFDVRHIRCIQYSNVMGADQKLRLDFDNALRALNYQES